MTPYQQHMQDWHDCTRCALHKVRRRVVFCRGTIPADILFIGEGPGLSEDDTGRPFIGPAGKLFDKMIGRAVTAAGDESLLKKMCWANLVGCWPNDNNPKRKRSEPLPEEIAACYPRLDEEITLCEPKLIFAVGALAEKQAKLQHWEKRAKVVYLIHPAALLQMDNRLDVSQKALSEQQATVRMSDAFCDLLVPLG